MAFQQKTRPRLTDALTRINDANDLPTLPNAPYEIVVSKDVTLVDTITVNRPMTIRGVADSVSIFGSDSIASGIVLSPSASGSTIKDLTFANFAGVALTLDNVTDTIVENISFINGGTGILAKGILTNTVARGNVFENLGKGLELDHTSAFTFGGNTIGEPNEIKTSTFGVYGNGELENTKLVNTVFSGNNQNRDLSAARLYSITNNPPTATIEALGSVVISIGESGHVLANGQTVTYSGSPIKSNQFNSWVLKAGERVNDTNQLLWQNSTTGTYFLWSLDESWAYQSGAYVAPNDSSLISQFIPDTDLDLNNIENDGSTALRKDSSGALFAGSNPLFHDGTQITETQFSGFTPVGVEDFGSNGGKQILWRADNGGYLAWSMTTSWFFKSQEWIANDPMSISNTLTEFGIFTDILDPNGSTLLHRNAAGEIFAGTERILYQGNAISVDQFAGFTPVATEDFGTNGGKQVLFEHDNGNFYAWNMSDSWQHTSGYWIFETGGEQASQALIDFGVFAQSLETSGSTRLHRDNNGGLFAGFRPIHYSGSQITENQFAGFTAVGVEDFGSGNGGKQILFEYTDGRYFVWSATESWEYSSGAWLNSANQGSTLASFGILPPLTAIESNGSTTLNRDTSGLIYAENTGITYGGSQITISQFAGFTAVAAEDFGSNNGGKKLVFAHTSGNYFVWSLDASWRFSSGNWVFANDMAGITQLFTDFDLL